ncbi:hypothetical protein Zmor_005273 [Zophobas morio]|uniref:Uncharacterized protein n=1 Tax=Zophobas morio TaxID=2755281 RepID=A0AA38IP21_9CUCU|nr:hypothetical protein Zmor_005273 [Zophobas morio]
MRLLVTMIADNSPVEAKSPPRRPSTQTALHLDRPVTKCTPCVITSTTNIRGDGLRGKIPRSGSTFGDNLGPAMVFCLLEGPHDRQLGPDVVDRANSVIAERNH